MAEAITQSGFFKWCLEVLHRLAELRTPLWDRVMSGVTVLGEEMAFIVVGLLVLWCINKRFGYRFLFIYMLGSAVNQLLKAIFMIPRPWMVDESLSIVESARSGATGFSFPSGHTQAAALMFGGIAAGLKKRWAWALAVVIALAVAFSRMYLGVHTLLDVGISLIVSVVILLIFMRPGSRLTDSRARYLAACGAVVLVGIVTAALLKTVCAKAAIPFCTAVEAEGLKYFALKDSWTILGTSLGLLIGYAVESKCVNFDTKAVWWVQIIKFVLGLAVIIGLRVALKPALALISESTAMNAVRYFIMSFVAIAVYPLLFKPLAKLGKSKS